MNLQQDQIGFQYEIIYRKHKKNFLKAGVWSIVLLMVFFFTLDIAITRWLTIGTFFDIGVFIVFGVSIVSLLGLIDKLPAMIKAHMASREDNIRRILGCKKILGSYRGQLRSVGYDVVSLERLSEEGMAPQEFEHIIRNILMTRAAQSKPRTPSPEPPSQKVKEVERPIQKSQESEKESILLLLREKEHEIKTRVRKGVLSKQQANVLIETARREARKKLNGLEKF